MPGVQVNLPEINVTRAGRSFRTERTKEREHLRVKSSECRTAGVVDVCICMTARTRNKHISRCWPGHLCIGGCAKAVGQVLVFRNVQVPGTKDIPGRKIMAEAPKEGIAEGVTHSTITVCAGARGGGL